MASRAVPCHSAARSSAAPGGGGVMRDHFGNHVSQLDEHGFPVDIDDVFVTSSVRGSFQVRYADNIDKVCLSVERFGARADVTMQLTLEQAVLLRALLAAGIADAIAASSERPALPAGNAVSEVSA